MEDNRKIRAGIVGCGTIGQELARAISERFTPSMCLLALCDIDRQKAENLRVGLELKPELLSLDELVKSCDLVIEAAAAAVALEVAQKALRQGRDVLIMSVGGILNDIQELLALAQFSGGHLYIPSGALAGLDTVKAAAINEIHRVTLTTRKPAQGLEGAPYLLKNNIDLSKITQETIIFEGNASEAIQGFPKNVNVCAALSLAGIGAQKTRVRIITSPEYRANIHEIELEGSFGRLFTRTENLPSPNNPKTSFLAALSAIATLKNISDVVKIGT